MKIEIDLTKIEKRISIKGTSKRKSHYRKIKGAEEVNKPISVLERTKQSMKAYTDSVSSDMIESVNMYASERYTDINSALRDGDLDDYADLIDDVNNISEFIENAPKFDGVVYRGMKEFRDPSDFDDFIEQLMDYESIEFPAFTSCSIEKNVADIFVSGDRNIMFEIESKSGVLLGDAADIPDENEVLFDYGTEFEIVSITEDNGSYFIKLRE